jgi:UDP-N-acetylmuramate--alanine ligase
VKFLGIQRIHFVGAGGIGMSGIAEVLLNMGFTVSGSDLKESPVTRRLAVRGARIAIGHRAENVGNSQVLVYSSAVSPLNPEIEEARRMGIPVIPRAEMLAELMRMKTSVAVAGSHGKTTVTAMVAHLLHGAGLDPTVVIGGRLSTLDASARLGHSDLLVAEADESDRSFLLLSPSLAVVTNIDWEHVDCYPELSDVVEAFLQFANRVPFYGACILCSDDPNARGLLPRLKRRAVTYGMQAPADFLADRMPSEGAGESFKLRVRGKDRGLFSLPQTGRHVVLDALAALAVCDELEVPLETQREQLATFPGADRRFQFRGEAGGVRVYDDYGHHPTEIRATFEAARRAAGKGRLVVLFQPHRYSRLAALIADFASVLSEADLVVVTDVYAASEPPISGVTGAALAARMKELGRTQVRYCPAVEDLPAVVLPLLASGDLVLTLGAGTITTIGEQIVAGMEGRP